MTEMVLLGDEAVAMGAVHAGLTASYAYPGTPSTEITEYLLRYAAKHGAPKAAWTANEKTAYEEALVAALISFTRRHGGSVLLFPQVCGPSQAEDDRLPSRRIAGRLQAAGVTALAIDGPWTPDDLQCAYGQMDLFAGTRLHSNIFALTAGTPVVAIAYYYKTYGVMQTVGLSEWVLDIRTLQAAEFEQRLELLWQQRAAVRDHLRRTLPLIQQQARRAAQRIRADFTEWSQP